MKPLGNVVAILRGLLIPVSATDGGEAENCEYSSEKYHSIS